MANLDVGGVTAELAIGFSDWSRGLQEALRDLQQFSASLTQVINRIDSRTTSSSEDVAQAFREMGQAISESIREASRTTSREAPRIGSSLDSLAEKADKAKAAGERLSGLGNKLMGGSAVVSAALTGAGAAALAAASEIEGYQVQLETLTGSAEQAQKKLGFFRDLAVTSPFSLKELVQSGVALEAYGQKAEQWLPKVGDFAASMNLDVTEAARGVGKALAGSSEGWEILRNAGVNGRRLAPFGASLTREGNVDPTDPRNAQALMGFLDALDGASAKKSETIAGRFSMVGDALFNTFAQVGAQIAPIAKQIADALTTVITLVGNLPPGLLVAAGVVAGVAAGLTALAGAVLVVVPGIAALPAAFAATSAAAAPFAPVLAGVAVAVVALGAAAAALAVAWAKNWGGIRQTVAAAVDQTKTFLAGFWPQVVSGFEILRVSVTRAWLGLWSDVQSRWVQFRAQVEPGLLALVDLFGATWGDIQRIADMTLAVLVPLVTGAFQSLAAQVRAAASIIGTVWSALWRGLKAAYEIAWPLISGLIESNLKLFRGIFEAALKVLDGDWRGAWEGLNQAARDSLQVLQDHLGQVLDRILQALKNFVPAVAEAGWNIGRALMDAITGAVSSSGSTLSDIQSGSQAASQGRGVLSTAGASVSSWYSSTMTSGAERRRVEEQQAYWESRRAKGEERRRQEEERKAAAQAATAAQVTAGATGAGNAKPQTPAQKVLAEASKRVGTSFLPGQVAQCARFVRDVYAAAGVQVGTTASPLDLAQTKGMPQGPGFANSFAGSDVGQVITDPSKLKAGDVVTYRNTYGAYAPGTITHAGIYAGGGQVIHRGTSGGAVSQVGLNEPGAFAYGVRPYALGGDRSAEPKMAAAREQLRQVGDAVGKDLTEQIDRQLAALREMSTQRIELMTSDTERERAELQARFQAMVDHWQQVAVATPALAQQAEAQITLVRQAEAEKIAALEKAQWQRRHEDALKDQEWQVQMGQQTHEQLTEFLASQLESWQGTEEGKRALMLQYRDAFSADLDAMREAQAAFDEEDLARLLETLQAKTELTLAERIRLDELLAEQEDLRNEKVAEGQAVAERVAGAIESSFTNAFVGILSGQMTFAQGMKTLWQSLVQTILAEIAKVIAKLLVLKAVQMLTGFFFPVGGGGGGVGGGAGSSLGALVSGSGNPLSGMPQIMHDGGVVGRGQLRADEVLTKLQAGEIVLSRDMVRSLDRGPDAGGGQSVNLTIQNLHNHGPQDVATMARDLGRRTAWYLQGA